MTIPQLVQRIRKDWVKGFRAALSVGLIAIAIGFSYPASALASSTLMADLSDVTREAKETFDDVFGAGASDRVEGNVDSSMGAAKQQAGKLKRQFDDDLDAGLGDQIEGQFDRVKGESKKQMGKAKGSVEDAFERAESMGKRNVNSLESSIENQQNKLENQTKSGAAQLKSVFDLDD